MAVENASGLKDGDADPATKQGRANGMEHAAQDKPENLTGTETASALAWFMSTDVEQVASAILPVNVAPAGHDTHMIDFKIQVVDRERINTIRKEASKTNAAGVEEINDLEANLQIAAEGLIEPDLSKDANRVVRGNRYLSAADALSARFAYKPGLIDQIAGAVVKISGYDDNDVKEVRAAKN